MLETVQKVGAFFLCVLRDQKASQVKHGKESVCQCGRFRRLGFEPWIRKIPLEKGMAIHSSIVA